MDNTATTATTSPTERRAAHRGPRTCEELGICQGRYPACGCCDDDHSADEPPTPTPFEGMWVWVATGFAVSAVFAVVGGLAGYLVTRFVTL